MTRFLPRWCAIALLAFIGFGWCAGANAAVTCVVTQSPDMYFGTIATLTTDQVDTTSTLGYRCSNDDTVLTYAATVCVGIGTSDRGGWGDHRMRNAASETLFYQIYKDSGRTDPWGDLSGPLTPMVLHLVLGPGQPGLPYLVEGRLTFYGRVIGGQQITGVGVYQDTFDSNQTHLTVNASSAQGTTPDPPADCGKSVTGFPFIVQTTVVPQCVVTAGTMDFGISPGPLTSAVDATTTIGVQCANGVPYTIGLDDGQNGTGGARALVSGSQRVGYQIYLDPGRTKVWGSAAGTNTAANVGTGQVQTITAFGRVPAQPTPAAGDYHDTIMVQVSY